MALLDLMAAPPPVRLLLVSQPLKAGVPRHVLDLVAHLDPATFEVAVACPPASELWQQLRERSGASLRPLVATARPSPADVVSLARLVHLVGWADVVHAHSSKAGLLVRLAAMLRGRTHRCVFTPHGWSFWSAGGLLGSFYIMLERLAARWCRVIIAVSACERDAGLAVGVGRPNQYRVIRNGADARRFRDEPSPVPGRVLAVARLAPQKRVDLLIRALAQVRLEHPQAELHVVGDGPDRRLLEATAADLGVSGAVRFLGERDDVPGLLAKAACVALASDYESCPLVVLEAMASGVPVVATAVGGVPELIQDGRTGILVPHGSVEGLAEGIASLIRDPGTAQAMGRAGRCRVGDSFSLGRSVATTESVYLAVAEGRPLPSFPM